VKLETQIGHKYMSNLFSEKHGDLLEFLVCFAVVLE